MDILVRIGQLLLSLSILIVLHEMGHFFPARWFKTRVEKFYLFFDAPPFGSLFKRKKGETEYGIGWLPLGGYVKIAGMVDESFDRDQMEAAPQPDEFRSKKAWQRLIIMIGGVTVNFLLGIVIYAFVLAYWGDTYISNSDLPYGTQMDSVLLREGFRHGDVLVKVGNSSIDRLDNGVVLAREVILNNARTAVVMRDGQQQTINLSDAFATKLASSDVQKKLLMSPRVPLTVGLVRDGYPAKAAGIQVGDQVVGLNEQTIRFFDEFQVGAAALKNQAANVKVLRGKDTLSLPMTVNSDGKVGISPDMAPYLKFQREKASIAGAIPAGWNKATGFLSDQVKSFGQMFAGKVDPNESLGGFISIGKLFPSEWDWEAFWRMTAALSIILAFMNLLPIPALDGGYVVFLIWEVITGRRVSDRVMERAVTVGFFLLLGLMVYVNGLDIWRGCFR